MRNPFKKKPTEIQNVVVNLVPHDMPFRHQLTVTHKYEPRPVPQSITIMIRDHDGREYRLMPVNLYGQTEQRLDFPMAFVTGNPGDVPVPMYMRLYYG